MIIPSEPKISTPIHLHLYTSCTCCKDALGQVPEVLLEYPLCTYLCIHLHTYTPAPIHLCTCCTCCKDALWQVPEVLLEYPRHSVHVALLQQLLRLVRVTLVSSLQIEIELEKEDMLDILMKNHDNLW